MDLSGLTIETFEPLVGDTFRDTEAGVALELLSVADDTPIARNVPEGARTPFSLFFRGPLEPVVPQGIRPLDHEKLGALDLFLAPVAQDADGTRYQAVFN